ncbi:MAG: hypothetical protein KGD74_03920 [Candidatus Lokiarchaeota archaeon]|nr:hypothetical protein [Candidatus Lokiarchaeota archaeon]
MKYLKKIRFFLLIFCFFLVTSSTINISSINSNENNTARKNSSVNRVKLAANTDGYPICQEGSVQGYPEICSDENGGAIIVWADKRYYENFTGSPVWQKNEYDIFAQRIDSNGDINWTRNGVAIITAPESQGGHKICSDGNGGAFIVWADARPSTQYFTFFDIYAQRINSSGDVQWKTSGIAICNAIYSQKQIQICSDGNEGAFIVWSDERDSGNYDIYAQRINSSGDVLWGLNGTAICTTSENQGLPQLCSDGNGGIIITWGDGRGSGPYAQRINSTGDAQWVINGIDVITYPYNQVSPRICSDGDGGAIIHWDDQRADGEYDGIYAQRINSTGDKNWTSNGVPIAAAKNWFELTSGMHQMISDENGGAIMAWADTRDLVMYFNIYTQRINSSGDVQWTIDGVAICTASYTQRDPQLCSDGNGGAIITWRDSRLGYPYTHVNIYAQSINSTGDVQWVSNGTVICKANGGQGEPQIVSDGDGGAIITWPDYIHKAWNYYDTDIYAQKINSDGEIQWFYTRPYYNVENPDDDDDDDNTVHFGPLIDLGEIPGYDLILVIAMIGIISIILARKISKQKQR